MSATLAKPEVAERVVLHGVSWDFYEALLREDPPPDLVVEVDISHHAVDRERVYAALGVPELWRFDGQRLEAWVLDPDGSYRQQDRSRAFAWLVMADLQRFLEMRRQASETAVMRAFRDWLRARPA